MKSAIAGGLPVAVSPKASEPLKTETKAAPKPERKKSVPPPTPMSTKQAPLDCVLQLLKENFSPPFLSLANERLNKKQFQDLCAAMRGSFIVGFDLSNTGIDDDKCADLVSLLDANRNICSLNLSNNKIDKAGAELLRAFLEKQSKFAVSAGSSASASAAAAAAGAEAAEGAAPGGAAFAVSAAAESQPQPHPRRPLHLREILLDQNPGIPLELFSAITELVDALRPDPPASASDSKAEAKVETKDVKAEVKGDSKGESKGDSKSDAKGDNVKDEIDPEAKLAKLLDQGPVPAPFRRHGLWIHVDDVDELQRVLCTDPQVSEIIATNYRLQRNHLQALRATPPTLSFEQYEDSARQYPYRRRASPGSYIDCTQMLYNLAGGKPHPARLAAFWLAMQQGGIDMGATFGKKQTILVHAAQRNNLPLMKLLIAAGGDPRARNGNGTDCLSVALAANAGPVAKHLVRMGFDVHFRNLNGKCAIDYARIGGKQSMRVYNELVEDMRVLLSGLLFRAGFAPCAAVIVQYLY